MVAGTNFCSLHAIFTWYYTAKFSSQVLIGRERSNGVIEEKCTITNLYTCIGGSCEMLVLSVVVWPFTPPELFFYNIAVVTWIGKVHEP